jgi:hypothetical protein
VRCVIDVSESYKILEEWRCESKCGILEQSMLARNRVVVMHNDFASSPFFSFFLTVIIYGLNSSHIKPYGLMELKVTKSKSWKILIDFEIENISWQCKTNY